MTTEGVRIFFATPGVKHMFRDMDAFGGSELRAWRLACDLALRPGYSVLMQAYDYGQPRQETVKSVKFLRDSSSVYERTLAGRLRWRFYQAIRRGRIEGHPSLREVDYHVWEATDADVYIAFGATDFSTRLARWCAVRGKKFVLMQGGDMDLDPAEPFAAEVYTFPGLSVAQTLYQHDELLRRFGRSSVILPNPIAIPSGGPFVSARDFVLWVGKSDQIKRPDRMIELARLCPDVPVVMVMNRANAAIFDTIKAHAPTNVCFVDAVEPEAIGDYYRRACALVSTSITEGFPNSFLEAGGYCTPVLSLDVDPAGMLTKHGAGLLSGGSLDQAAGLLQDLWSGRRWEQGSLARTLGENSFHYVCQHHAQEKIFMQFEKILLSCVERRR